MPVKILFLIDFYQGPHAGTEGQLMQLLNWLDRTRFEPSLALFRESEYSRRNTFPCPVRTLGITRLASVRTIAKMLRFAIDLRRENYQLVHCFFNDSSMIAPFFMRLLGIRVLVSRRDMGFWYTRWNLPVLRLASRFVDCYVTNSEMVKHEVQLRERVPAGKITVIYNGYAPGEAAHQPNSEPGPDGEPTDSAPTVGIVANLRPIKRIDTLIEAFGLISEKFPRAQLVIVGDNTSEQARATYEGLDKLARRLGIRDRVFFTGRVDHPATYIEKFSVAVLCSESEGFSNSLVEYMRAQLPVVCTDTGGNPEIVQDGRNGFLVPVGSPVALADRLDQLLSDSALARRVGSAAYETALTFTHTRMVNAQMRCYDRLLSGGSDFR
jgi:glycosyltransferase involved in cell wall biosynthesis